MKDEERFQELKEKEIKRLTSPLTYSKGKWNVPSAYIDCEGNEVDPINTFNGKKYIMEPKTGILSDDEILIYASESKEASKIRLRRGTGNFNDKKKLYGKYAIYFFFVIFPGWIIALFSFWLWIVLIIISIIILAYIFIICDFTDNNSEENLELDIDEQRLSNNDELFLLFENKEKIAREMVEKRFPAPQMTNIKFNSALDNCKEVVESQIEILNALIPTEKTKYEIDSRKKLINQLISKVDDLTNELILSEENNIEDVIEDMDNLINSVKEYK